MFFEVNTVYMEEDMEEQYTAEAVRERLIIAGIRELEAHGLNDFSLRRVAMACEVSCAAPYRHFKSKEELILEIIRYINRQWELLRDQIALAFPNDTRKQLIEIGIAHIRFWIANPNFRSVLLLDTPKHDDPRHAEREKISRGLKESVCAYGALHGLSEDAIVSTVYAYEALIYGTVLMLGNQELENTPSTIQMIRARLESLLPD